MRGLQSIYLLNSSDIFACLFGRFGKETIALLFVSILFPLSLKFDAFVSLFMEAKCQ